MKLFYTIVIAVVAWFAIAFIIGTRCYTSVYCKAVKRYSNRCVAWWSIFVAVTMFAVVEFPFVGLLSQFWVFLGMESIAADIFAGLILLTVVLGLHYVYRRIVNSLIEDSKERAKNNAANHRRGCLKTCRETMGEFTTLDCDTDQVDIDKCACKINGYTIGDVKFPDFAVQPRRVSLLSKILSIFGKPIRKTSRLEFVVDPRRRVVHKKVNHQSVNDATSNDISDAELEHRFKTVYPNIDIPLPDESKDSFTDTPQNGTEELPADEDEDIVSGFEGMTPKEFSDRIEAIVRNSQRVEVLEENRQLNPVRQSTNSTTIIGAVRHEKGFVGVVLRDRPDGFRDEEFLNVTDPRICEAWRAGIRQSRQKAEEYFANTDA